MSAYIFTGPTISSADAERELEATYLPPAAEGDVYRAARKRPVAIGIIDGYFQSTPSVRHKEILWAMSQGIHVFGSASMGALRAAELVAFGMEGIGKVFEAYRDGSLTDDDEVTIAHGPAETGYVSASEAMVNIRHTFRKAQECRIISSELESALVRLAKQLFYPERTYPRVLCCAREAGVPEKAIARLRAWLPEGRVNQKREDAVAMLRLIHNRLTPALEAKRVAYSFERTSMWEAMRSRYDAPSSAPAERAISRNADRVGSGRTLDPGEAVQA